MLQAAALRIIYGHKKSYSALLHIIEIESLRDRRSRLVDKFVLKTAANPAFEDWFPLKNFTHHDLRVEKIYHEEFARTDRLYKSPIYTYRRRLNEIDVHNLNKRGEK